ncbi:MAG: exodeoxyribonuclease VII small subunit [Spirochaetales bacterium]|nr:MAG: exodeoxyribonuclease VII small subunit [Spirochaetales bacterium]
MKNFEERLERLETISDEINSGGATLDKALALFEEGIKLARGLEKDIGKIERKIEILINQPVEPDDKPNFELFDDLEVQE